MTEDVKLIYIHILKNNHAIGDVVGLKNNEMRVCVVVRGSTIKTCIPAIYKLKLNG